MSPVDDLEVFRPRGGGSSVYLPDDRVRSLHVLPAGGPLPEPEETADAWSDGGSDCYAPHGSGTVTLTIRVDATRFLRALARTGRFLGLNGRHAPARALVEKADRHRRNARGFVPGAHPAARPMHEAYRARRRRRSGRR